IIGVILGCFYIAVMGLDYEVVGDELGIRMKNWIMGIGFGGLIEGMVMEIRIEVIREGGVGVGKGIGERIGMVGGLVIGDGVVKGGVIWNVVMVVVGVSGVGWFVVGWFEMRCRMRMVGFGVMLMAWMFGFIGI
ncbi:spore germination protein, partial [Bacillus altitudinis]|uniref:spore germination protein n=1 Tax=Bacillus altitudinis TaxID=293387 RepID=UPI0011A8BFEE